MQKTLDKAIFDPGEANSDLPQQTIEANQVANAVILGNTRGVRSLDTARSYSLAMQPIEGVASLDWNLHAFDKIGLLKKDITFIGGYHIERVIESHPDLHIKYDRQWEHSNPLANLRFADDLAGKPFVLISDRVVFRPEALTKILNSKASLVVGTIKSSESDASSPIPLFYLDHHASSIVFQNIMSARLSDKPDLFEIIDICRKHDLSIAYEDVSQHAALLLDGLSLSRFLFCSKAETLCRLQPLTRKSIILDQVRFTVEQWRNNPRNIIIKARGMIKRNALRKELSCDFLRSTTVAVRSCSRHEDNWETSQAGRFESILNVPVNNTLALSNAIEKVISSFTREDTESQCLHDEVFIQPCLNNVMLSGAVLTRDMETDAPYYTFNFDRSGKTDVVTGGLKGETETVIAWRGVDPNIAPAEITQLLEVTQEVECLFGYDRLDIEFAISASGKVYLLQVRPLVGAPKKIPIIQEDIDQEIESLSNNAQDWFREIPHLLGKNTVLGNMTDWNPAEMLGRTPGPLALSLYQYLITDESWAVARARMGYRDVTGTPLMLCLGGHPYIDLRASFNSFVPANLDDEHVEKIVEVYKDHLLDHPELHDKIEFDVAVTCMDFEFERHRQRLESYGLDNSVITVLSNELAKLTQNLIVGERHISITYYRELIELLGPRRMAVLDAIKKPQHIPRAIWQLLVDCKNFGTIPFSILARHGFVALSILRSLVARGVLSQEEYDISLMSIPTMATEVSESLSSLMNGTYPVKDFFASYGHLRPNSYDILSPNYKQLLENGNLGVVGQTLIPKEHVAGSPCIATIFEKYEKEISMLTKESSLNFSPNRLCEYIRQAISGREWAKFEFMKSVNAILELVAEYGAWQDLSREDMSYLPITELSRLATNALSIAMRQLFLRQIEFSKKS